MANYRYRYHHLTRISLDNRSSKTEMQRYGCEPCSIALDYACAINLCFPRFIFISHLTFFLSLPLLNDTFDYYYHHRVRRNLTPNDTDFHRFICKTASRMIQKRERKKERKVSLVSRWQEGRRGTRARPVENFTPSVRLHLSRAK